ncbi:MSHA biogenesis protein MshP [Psychrosphaera aquimarina]|uniref:MSHA biogenesis protein MshP n=1 Tax=Psychrosphaera aquimarina TaxID=2044854 RepID=A0ABU3R218_9GAMM|nr:MSHA biogenesis protein MshP [Psychrosphaera aquimarina]MDU0113716.1 MSHA biogenesis protein MshP [Psychrosphaera aquimarina]
MSINRIKQTKPKQKGSALAIAVFIIVIMAALAAGISKSISSNTDQLVFEVLGTRALFAAESANEIALAQLFPVSGGVGICTAEQSLYLNVDGLRNCAVKTYCSNKSPGASQYYQVVSTAVCKANMNNNSSDFICTNEKVCVSRTIEVEAKAL